jgi:hypothetical protein
MRKKMKGSRKRRTRGVGCHGGGAESGEAENKIDGYGNKQGEEQGSELGERRKRREEWEEWEEGAIVGPE